ncbi:uncharacterized protein LOC129875705 [Solanum dulcamara]|uniref:uncharacterized protein LOC129875705 n=1 Tax=Solanum dulcamara TaxID=45834 RepID=UPI0024851081|nr:uncharacterized protein LOC129875705 [Solanum dulcamara]
MVNDKWLDVMPVTPITHLASTGSDHCPLLLECVNRQVKTIKYFKFLQCWVDNDAFLDTVKTCWERPIEGSPIRRFHQKLKRVSNTLSNWSRQQYGDIFTTMKDFEEKVRNVEDSIINDNSESNRTNLSLINTQYSRYLKVEQSIFKQKTQLQWFKDGDANSKYFHAIIRGRRRRLYIHSISDEKENIIQGDEDIAKAACDHFVKIFIGDNKIINEEVISCIPRSVTEQQNLLSALPTK